MRPMTSESRPERTLKVPGRSPRRPAGPQRAPKRLARGGAPPWGSETITKTNGFEQFQKSTKTSGRAPKDRQSRTSNAPRLSQDASEHAGGPLQGTLGCARVCHGEHRDRSEVPGNTPGTHWRHPSMTLEHNENIEKPLVLNVFEHICEASSAARLPQSPQQRPKNVHATRGGPRRGPFAPNDIRKPS